MLDTGAGPRGGHMKTQPTPQDVLAAARRVREVVRRTPLLHSRPLSEQCGARVHLKLENLLFPVNSFKLRGAYNKMATLTDEEKRTGVVAVSAGNHSQAVAWCATRLGIRSTIFMPENAPQVKVEKTREFGAEVLLRGRDYDHSERLSHEYEAQTGKVFIHPFFDERIIAGQGTVALEVFEALEDVDTLVVPVGGGGLALGCALAARAANRDVEIIGVQPEASAPFHHALAAGRYVETPILDSLADALTGDIISEDFFDFFRRHIRRVSVVNEDDIAYGIYWMLKHHGLVVEGGGAAGVAALLRGRLDLEGKNAAVIVTGSGIDFSKLMDIVHRFEKQAPPGTG